MLNWMWGPEEDEWDDIEVCPQCDGEFEVLKRDKEFFCHCCQSQWDIGGLRDYQCRMRDH